MKKHASQPWLPMLLYLATIVTLVGCIGYFGWTRTWSAVFVPTMSPPFADMRVIQGAATSSEQGLNPLISNPNDPWHRSIIYPLIWVEIGQLVNLTDESRFIQFCCLMIFCFVAICAYILYRFPSYGLLACVLSTATLLGIERGNIDLIIYSLAFVFALVFPTKFSPIPILVATALKLYPMFLLGALLIKRQFILFFTSLIFVLAILYYLWDQLLFLGVSHNQVFDFASYGFPVLALNLSAELPSWIVAGAIIVVILAITLYFRKIEDHQQPNGFEFSLFLAGATIYIGTFIFSWNWDYRLIFLIFCVPFLKTKQFPFGGVLVTLIVVAMNDLILTPWLGALGLAIVWFAKIVIFAVLSAYLAAFVVTIFSVSRKIKTGNGECHTLSSNAGVTSR
jgi:hypothetical protein